MFNVRDFSVLQPVPTELGPPCKELKGINHSHKGPSWAEGSRYSSSSSLLFFSLVSRISHYIVCCAARVTNKPTKRKQLSDMDSCVKCQSFPEGLFSVMRKPKRKLSEPDAAEASGRGSLPHRRRGTTSGDAPFACTTWKWNLHQKFLSCQPAARWILNLCLLSRFTFLCQSSGRNEALSESSSSSIIVL